MSQKRDRTAARVLQQRLQRRSEGRTAEGRGAPLGEHSCRLAAASQRRAHAKEKPLASSRRHRNAAQYLRLSRNLIGRARA